MHTREEIFNTLRGVLIELFEIEPERITLEANLYTDLEIDSIDAIDLIDQVRRRTGRIRPSRLCGMAVAASNDRTGEPPRAARSSVGFRAR